MWGRVWWLRVVLSSMTLLAACTEDARTLVWEVELADPGLGEDLRAVEATVHRGGCDERDGEPLYRTVQQRGDGAAPMAVPPLEEGTYSFSARARDDGCAWYAAGCETLELPRPNGESVVVRLDAVEQERACPWESCVGGRCVDRDGPMGEPCGAGVGAGDSCGPDGTGELLGVCRRSEPVDLDGDPVELLDAVPIRIERPELSATYRLQWDCSALYVSAIVTDPDLSAYIPPEEDMPRDPGRLYESDSVEVMMDVALDRAAEPQEDDRHVIVNLDGRIRDEYGDIGTTTGWNPGLTIDALRLGIDLEGRAGDGEPDVGWRIELAIPWDGLGLTECPDVGRVLGLDLAANHQRVTDPDAGTGALEETVDWADLGSYGRPEAWNCIQLLDTDGAP